MGIIARVSPKRAIQGCGLRVLKKEEEPVTRLFKYLVIFFPPLVIYCARRKYS